MFGGTYRAFYLNLLATVSLHKVEQESTAKLSEESLALNREANNVQGIAGSLLPSQLHRATGETMSRLKNSTLKA